MSSLYEQIEQSRSLITDALEVLLTWQNNGSFSSPRGQMVRFDDALKPLFDRALDLLNTSRTCIDLLPAADMPGLAAAAKNVVQAFQPLIAKDPVPFEPVPVFNDARDACLALFKYQSTVIAAAIVRAGLLDTFSQHGDMQAELKAIRRVHVDLMQSMQSQLDALRTREAAADSAVDNIQEPFRKNLKECKRRAAATGAWTLAAIVALVIVQVAPLVYMPADFWSILTKHELFVTASKLAITALLATSAFLLFRLRRSYLNTAEHLNHKIAVLSSLKVILRIPDNVGDKSRVIQDVLAAVLKHESLNDGKSSDTTDIQTLIDLLKRG